MNEWWKEFDLVKLPSVPDVGNIYRNEKCVVINIQDYNKIINTLKEAEVTAMAFDNIDGWLNDVNRRLSQAWEAVEKVKGKHEEMMKKKKEYINEQC